MNTAVYLFFNDFKKYYEIVIYDLNEKGTQIQYSGEGVKYFVTEEDFFCPADTNYSFLHLGYL